MVVGTVAVVVAVPIGVAHVAVAAVAVAREVVDTQDTPFINTLYSF
jgi:hypothetical protein